jgi:hypothetical protein
MEQLKQLGFSRESRIRLDGSKTSTKVADLRERKAVGRNPPQGGVSY